MNPKLIELAERRAALVARAEVQRKNLSQALASWRRPLAYIERGGEAVRSLAQRPELLVGLAFFAVVVRPWRFVRWLPPGWAVWRIARLALGTRKMLRGL